MPGALGVSGLRYLLSKMYSQDSTTEQQPPRPHKNNNNNNNYALNGLETAITCSVETVDAYKSHMRSKRSPYAFSDYRCDYSDMESDSGPPRPPDPQIYSPPTRQNNKSNDGQYLKHYRAGHRLDRQGGHRRTWSPPAFSQALSLASQLKSQRIYRSNDQLDNEAIYEELPDGPVPPRLPLVSGQLQDAERPMIKPVAYKPMTKSIFHLMGSQQRLASSSGSQPSSTVASPEMALPAMASPALASPAIASPAIASPAIASPAIASPTPSHSSGKSLTSPKSTAIHSKSSQQQPLVAPSSYRLPSQTSTPKPALPSPTVSGLSPTRLTDFRLGSQDEGYVSQECNSQNLSSSNLSPPSLPQGDPSNANQSNQVTKFYQQPHPLTRYATQHSTEGKIPNSFSYHEHLASYQIQPSARSASYGDLTEIASGRREEHSEDKKNADPSLVASYLTPSPSDSGLGELEAMVRDKDAEIAALRATMAANENAMMKVHEEKRQNWEMEMREMSAEWESRLRTQQQKTFRMEQALLLQLFKIQQERKTLRLDCEQLRTENEVAEDKAEKLTQDLSESQSALEELRWDMCQKTGEISMLKKNVKQSNVETTNRSQEVINVRSQAKELQNMIQMKDQELAETTADLSSAKIEVETLKAEIELLKMRPQTVEAPSQTDCSSLEVNLSTGAMPRDIHSLQQELLKARTEISGMNVRHEADKKQWLDEKNKVIRYQKHLQLNYVQMYKKNKTLECEIEQLMVELENRDLRLTEVNPHGPNSPQESMC